MPCSHVSGVTDPEEGIDDFRPPPPFSALPVCLSPSLLHSFHGRSVRLKGRKACCFDAGSLDQIPLAECCVDPAENTTASSSSLQKAPWLRELQLCVSVCSWFWSKLQGVPRTHKLIHTTLFQQGGKVIGFADARVASEKVLGSLTKVFYIFWVIDGTALEFFNLGDFCPTLFQPFFSFGRVSQNRLSVLLVLRLFVFVWVKFWLFWVCFWGSGSEPDSKDKRNVAGLFWSLVFCLPYLLSYSVLCEMCIERLRECLCVCVCV